MKKFKFTLEKVLNLRQKELENISKEYMECLLRLNRLKDDLLRLRDQAKACEMQRNTKLLHSVSSQELRAMLYKEDALRHCISEAVLKVSAMEAQEQFLLNRRHNKKKEVNGLEKLREKQYIAYNLEIMKQTENNIDAMFNYSTQIKKM